MKEFIYIYGKHAVESAIQNKPEVIEVIFLSDKYKDNKEFISEIKNKNIEIQNFDGNALPKEVLENIDDFGTHQGIVAKIRLVNLLKDGKEFLKTLESKNGDCYIILGELNDPQNVGNILRSAEAFGINGVFIPEHNQVQVTGSVVKVSAGAAFTVPMYSIGNINQTIEVLKEKRFWIYGLEKGSENTVIYDEKFSEPTVFIVGNEHDGIREKTKEHCDILVSIPLAKKSESLNAGNSLAIALYEFRRQNIL